VSEPHHGIHPWIERLRAQRERHRNRHTVSRFAFAIAGFVCMLVGLALLVLPGPGLLVIAAGLGLLALEFDWAERWLERTLLHTERAAKTAKKAPLWQQIVVGVLLSAAGLAVTVWFFLADVPVIPG
jgi:uncharacterized protein (TIGR02611 family)